MNSLIIPFYHITDELVEITKRCLNSLKYEPVDEVILVDDCSPIREDFPGYQVIRNLENRGYTHSVNRGLEAAQGDVLIVGNNDLIFTPGWLTSLREALEEHDIATLPTSDQTWETQDKITKNDKFGSLFAMSRATYEKLGPLDERFRGYFVDTDFRRRALNSGMTIGKNWNCLVEHEAKSTYSQVDGADEEFIRAKEIYKSKWGGLE